MSFVQSTSTPLQKWIDESSSSPGNIFIFSLLGAALSLVVTGFVFGTCNNLFHLPIVGRMYDEPQFAQDSFIQSLRYFASGVWLLLRGTDRFISPYWLFLGAAYVSRIIAFAGFLSCADLLGIKTQKQMALFSLLLAFSALLQGSSYAGGGGLFIKYFTHSEIANGFSLLSLSFIIRNRFVAAHAMNGITFFVNAFVAVWNALPLLLLTCCRYFAEKANLKKIVFQSLLGSAVFLVLAAPVIYNIVSSPAFGAKLTFNYVSYLKEYWPYHFLISTIPLKEILKAVLIIAIAFLSFHKLGASAKPFNIALSGYIIVYLMGACVPFLTHSPTILNLHLLRVSTFFHLLAALGATTLAVRWFEDMDPYVSKLTAPAFAVLLCLPKLVLLAPLFFIVVSLPYTRRLTFTFAMRNRAYLISGLVTLLLAALSYSQWRSHRWNTDISKQIEEFFSLGAWAKSHTPQDAIFLMLTTDIRPSDSAVTKPDEEPPKYDNTIFEYASHRRVWVDYKRGAAIMWYPPYYEVWHTRIEQVLALKSMDEKMSYASKNSIGYVVDYCQGHPSYAPLYTGRNICLYSVKAAD
ncbi:MAG: hypothetical protein WC521_05855 [Bdellovibrionales bacterium]